MRPGRRLRPGAAHRPRAEAALLAALGEFPRVVAQAAELREPHRVARYLEELAGTLPPVLRRLPGAPGERRRGGHRPAPHPAVAGRGDPRRAGQRPRPARRQRPGADVEADRCVRTRPVPSHAEGYGGPPRADLPARPTSTSCCRSSGRARSGATSDGGCTVGGRRRARPRARARHARLRPRRGRLPGRAAEFRDGFAVGLRVLAGADVYYAGKAFLCTAVARWVAEEGLQPRRLHRRRARRRAARRLPGRADRLPRQQQVDRRDRAGRSTPASAGSSSTRFEEIDRRRRRRGRARRASRRCWSG